MEGEVGCNPTYKHPYLPFRVYMPVDSGRLFVCLVSIRPADYSLRRLASGIFHISRDVIQRSVIQSSTHSNVIFLSGADAFRVHIVSRSFPKRSLIFKQNQFHTYGFCLNPSLLTNSRPYSITYICRRGDALR